MTDIKWKVHQLHQELIRANDFVKNVICALEGCNDQTNLTETIGFFAREIPEFRILAERRVSCLSCIRQVCTGELSVEKALELFRTAEKQLNEALNCITI